MLGVGQNCIYAPYFYTYLYDRTFGEVPACQKHLIFFLTAQTQTACVFTRYGHILCSDSTNADSLCVHATDTFFVLTAQTQTACVCARYGHNLCSDSTNADSLCVHTLQTHSWF